MSAEDCIESAPCGKDDYDYKLTECSNGKQNKSYYWTEPIFCDTKKSALPASEIIDCPECNPGKYRATNSTNQSTYCKSCEEGT